MWWPPRLGEPLPRGAEAVGIHHKLETSSLVLGHGRGGDKALVFQRALGPVRGIGTHDKRVVPVSTGWQLRYVGDRPRLVTAYIKKRR